MKNMTQKIAPWALWISALAIRKSLNVSTIIAPHFVIVTPLLGSFLSAASVCTTFTALTFVNMFLYRLPITLGIPTFFATLSWTSAHRSTKSQQLLDAALHLLVPIVCMALFIAHPTGNGAIAYTFYWIIPMLAWAARHVTNTSMSFIFALQSTFVAHAVGSVIWLYTVPMTSEQWLALIPLVAIERLTIAGSSSLLYEVGKRCVAWMGYKKTSQATAAIKI